MKFIKRSWWVLFSIYGFMIFLILMFLLLPMFFITFLMEPVKGGNLLIRISRFWADAFFLLTGIRYSIIYEEPHLKNKEYIFVSNHISFLDIPMMLVSIRGQKLRILGKAGMARIPIFGSIYKRGAVLVNRGSHRARTESIKQLINFLEKKISVFICPEGTFNMTHQPLKFFYNGAFRIAIETQIPIKPILFLDTYDRLNYNSIFSLNPGRCRAVYLAETQTIGMAIEDLEHLKAQIHQQMQSALIKYKASWIETP